jgi:prepilin-type N-terminal cleavage/methylation domain-containing protein
MNKNRRGFTIIEVLIVLAVAGLIILIVFLAVPALQRAQRDTRRKNDLSKFYAAVLEYQNNSGTTNTPFMFTATDSVAFDNFVHTHLGPEFDTYDIEFKDREASHSFPYAEDKLVYFPAHYCSTDESEQVGTGSGVHPHYAWAVLIGMERSHNYFCLDQGNSDL